MRIAQKELKGYKPVAQYTRLVNGVTAIVEVYQDPCYCVNISRVVNAEVIKHCYPISATQYYMYLYEAEEINHPDKSILKEKADKYKDIAEHVSDVNLKVFFNNVSECYRKRL